MLDAEDNYLSRDRWSYPLLAEHLRRWSSRPQHDCAELFRRMVFNAAVTNNDDHPRNHALLRHPDGWRLSPVYDVVPVPVVSLERRRSRDALYLGGVSRWRVTEVRDLNNTLDTCARLFACLFDARC
ncbi:MAG: hypothetical protein JWO04_4365 [Gammaproteobacteria bacterium]|nr:hypothetical protein [Gammaproteobacteria bacterium]